MDQVVVMAVRYLFRTCWWTICRVVSSGGCGTERVPGVWLLATMTVYTLTKTAFFLVVGRKRPRVATLA